MTPRWFPAVAFSAALVSQTTVALAQKQHCMTAETEERLDQIIETLGVAGMVVLAVKGGGEGRLTTLGEALDRIDQAWTFGEPLLVEVCPKPPTGLAYDHPYIKVQPLYQQIPRNPDWPAACLGRLPPSLCSPNPLGSPPR